MHKSTLFPIILALKSSIIYAKSSRSLIRQYASKPTLVFHEENNKNTKHRPLSSILSINGGGSGDSDNDGGKEMTKRKKKKKKKSKASKTSKTSKRESKVAVKEDLGSGKTVIKEALKEDIAASMGDAIRARSSILLQDDLSHPIHHGDMTLNSISYAIGSSEQQHQQHNPDGNNNSPRSNSRRSNNNNPFHDYSGGVEPNSSAVIASYFLKSHGGLHGVQSIMSLFAVLFGLGTFAVPSTNASLKVRLMQRTLICALAKHLSGFIAAATTSASRLPDIGWRETKVRVERFALDPVAQYLFYCALLILWTNGIPAALTMTLNAPLKVAGTDAAAAATTAATTAMNVIPWWLKDTRNFYCIVCLIGPILLREIVSTIWVISDVLVLQHSSNIESSPSMVLKVGKGAVDATMSLLLTPSQWRGADAPQRQKLLAKLVARASLAMEIGTGLILTIDAARAFLDYSVSPMGSRPPLITVMKRLICARLYINFMLVRRRKVIDLVKNLRGGFVHVPGRVLDTLLEPQKAMGLDWGEAAGDDDDKRPKNGIEWIAFLAGF